MYVCMYVCMYVRIYVCAYIYIYIYIYVCMHVCMYVLCRLSMQLLSWQSRGFSAGTVTILRTKQQEFNSRRGEWERGSGPKVIIVLVRQATKLRAYRASLVHSGQQ